MSTAGVIFDLDGTLYRMHWYMKPLFFVRLFPHGLRLPAYMRVREGFAGKDLGNSTDLLRSMSAVLGEGLGVDGEQALRWIEHSFYPAFVSMMTAVRGSRKGVPALLGTLRGKGVRTAVLSDFAMVAERLDRLEITPSLFDSIRSCEQAGSLKPCPRPFLQIAREWGMNPSDIIVVGDRDDTDGAGARAAGMQFLLLKGKSGLGWKDVRTRLTGLG